MFFFSGPTDPQYEQTLSQKIKIIQNEIIIDILQKIVKKCHLGMIKKVVAACVVLKK